MQHIDQDTITEAVLQSFEACDDARLKQILQSLTTHLHDFARETRLTEDERMKASSS